MEVGWWWRRRPAPPMIRPPPCPPLPVPPVPHPSPLPAAAPAPPWLAPSQPGRASEWPKRCLWSSKTAFWPQKRCCTRSAYRRENAKWAPNEVKMQKGSSKHQRNHCLEQGLRKGAETTQKGAPKCKNRFLAHKTAFCAQNRFLSKK